MKKIIIVFFIISQIMNMNVWADELHNIIINHHEHLDETLYILDRIFSTRKDDYIDEISNSDFMRSNWYGKLKEYAKFLSINLNHRIETCNKSFIINNNEKDILVVIFQKNRNTDNIWYLEDAYIEKNRIKTEFQKYGFTPLSPSRYFDDLLDVIKKEDKRYFGLIKYGKLNELFLKETQLGLSEDTKVTCKNIVIHNKGKIEEIIYLSFQYYPVGHKERKKNRSGWLLVDAGLMSDFYKSEKDIYIDYMIGKIKAKDLELSKPNELIAVNLQNDILYDTSLKEEEKQKPHEKIKKFPIYNEVKQIIGVNQNNEKPKYIRLSFVFEKDVINLNSLRQNFKTSLQKDKLKIKLIPDFFIDEAISNIQLNNCGISKFSFNNNYFEVDIPSRPGFNVYHHNYVIKNNLLYIDVFYE